LLPVKEHKKVGKVTFFLQVVFISPEVVIVTIKNGIRSNNILRKQETIIKNIFILNSIKFLVIKITDRQKQETKIFFCFGLT